MRLTTLATLREALSTITSNCHTIRLSNLSWVTSKKQLFDHFSQFGNIKNITLPLDKRFGVHRGYAFIDFDDEESIRKVLIAGQIQQIDEATLD
uniref:RRM domain-containing protein n=1 Tax=Parascaris univalens TaxID=6257 RepID=A0A915CIW5_PARUN